ncbi:PP2C family protein-serine/threonine phosphatase [Streptomyces sp. NPDC020800]|uniref:PP2C family protein-serine/threonine phosphatase n=1 Tax=Streptomyces sp. NPDC020800 TaxID=3365092 RepID=UPI00379622F1
MLTDLPVADHVEISALYQAAANENMIGGDWYDAYHLPSARSGGPPSLRITVGDITGHGRHAATVMGRVRSMLRPATLDHPPYSPARAVAALEVACSIRPIKAGTLVHARLAPVRDGPGWYLTWCNAGHPPLLLRTPDAHVALLTEHDILLHQSLGGFHRTDHRRTLSPGSTLLLYTDGLIERPGTPTGSSSAPAHRRAHRAPRPEHRRRHRTTRRPAGPPWRRTTTRPGTPDQQTTGGPTPRGRRCRTRRARALTNAVRSRRPRHRTVCHAGIGTDDSQATTRAAPRTGRHSACAPCGKGARSADHRKRDEQRASGNPEGVDHYSYEECATHVHGNASGDHHCDRGGARPGRCSGLTHDATPSPP